MGRKPLIVGNWKMNRTVSEGVALARELRSQVADLTSLDLAVCPTFTSLDAVGRAIEGSNIALGAQDSFWEAQGAFTGEVSAAQLKDVGCRYVILGHSERRRHLGETSEEVHRKLRAVLACGLAPILCVGESLEEREANETFEVVCEQTERSIGNLAAEAAGKLVMAYEPVWAIGTGKNATAQQAQEVHAMLREQLGKLLGSEISGGMRLLYGGSVNAANAKGLMAESDIDGALVGGASLVAEEFAAIARAKAQ
ncbi:MAG TPA: triose-phosphate isomerase [Anaeromyxobacteraceae bacterium]|nr:triose-phosphate isomerase [Anaeromyxobacteraceae bacterium]